MKRLAFALLICGLSGCTKEATLYRCKACVIGESNTCVEHVDTPTIRCSSEKDARFSAKAELCDSLRSSGRDICRQWDGEQDEAINQQQPQPPEHIAITCASWKARVTSVPIFFSGR